MQHVVDQTSAAQTIEHTSHPPPHVMTQDTTPKSLSSSPNSKQALFESKPDRLLDSVSVSTAAPELTPPSSVASAQAQHDVDKQSVEVTRVEGTPMTSTPSGKKRTASGQLKQSALSEDTPVYSHGSGHIRHIGTLSETGRTNVGELSQQLRTKLTYAMLKVQNGWHKHTLDEIESIASQSPGSNLSNFTAREHQSLVSPRDALAASRRQNSDTSHSSYQSSHPQLASLLTTTVDAISDPGPASSNTRKALAPPAPIVPGNRRRPTPNMHLQINSTLQPPSRPIRPTTTQRTPSQNAAMEADAVETLLFMSASPSNSAHFPSHLSAYSPTSQAFSTQTSPLKSGFSVHDRGLSGGAVERSPDSSRRHVRYEDKTALIDRLLNELNDDESEELDRAVRIIEQHHATKLST